MTSFEHAGSDLKTDSAPPSAGAASRAFIYFLIFTTILCGALVMVIEVLGARMLGPFFGVSLFVWTSLITVTLIALAAGYAIGGSLSDKRSNPTYLYGIILIAGFFVFLIPITKGIILKACVPLGLRAGALVSSLLLFGPSLFLLGCVSPYIIKVAADEMRTIGKTVGIFYALSTLGSVFGTVLTGFVLIAYLGINRILESVALLLIGTALFYLLFFRKQFKALFIVLLFIPLMLLRPVALESKVTVYGERITVLFSKDTYYGALRVVDYLSPWNTRTRVLLNDGVPQSGIVVSTGQAIMAYTYFLQFLPYTLNPDGKNCLVIGLGAGSIPMWYDAQGVSVDTVDINPVMLDIAKNYFGFHISGDTIIADARYFLREGTKKYDYIILDVFNGDSTPGHILNLEALRELKQRLTPRGILAMNILGDLRGHDRGTAAIVRTIKKVFETVEVHPVSFSQEQRTWGNLAVIAYSYPPTRIDYDRVEHFPVNADVTADVHQNLDKVLVLPDVSNDPVLSDDYNPIDFYDSPIKEQTRRYYLKSTDLDLLL